METWLGLYDLCRMFRFRQWILYFYSEGLGLEEIQVDRHLLRVSKLYSPNPSDTFIPRKNKLISLVRIAAFLKNLTR